MLNRFIEVKEVKASIGDNSYTFEIPGFKFFRWWKPIDDGACWASEATAQEIRRIVASWFPNNTVGIVRQPASIKLLGVTFNVGVNVRMLRVELSNGGVVIVMPGVVALQVLQDPDAARDNLYNEIKYITKGEI